MGRKKQPPAPEERYWFLELDASGLQERPVCGGILAAPDEESARAKAARIYPEIEPLRFVLRPWTR